MTRRPTKGQDGFTLIEVLVALTIFAVSIGVLLGAFSDGLDQTRRAKDEVLAGSLAQSLLAQAGIDTPLQDGRSVGEFPNGFRWRLEVEPYGDAADREAWPVDARRIAAVVSWQDGLRERSVTLSTLRLVPKGP